MIAVGAIGGIQRASAPIVLIDGLNALVLSAYPQLLLVRVPRVWARNLGVISRLSREASGRRTGCVQLHDWRGGTEARAGTRRSTRRPWRHWTCGWCWSGWTEAPIRRKPAPVPQPPAVPFINIRPAPARGPQSMFNSFSSPAPGTGSSTRAARPRIGLRPWSQRGSI
jgi:hypothetical protein